MFLGSIHRICFKFVSVEKIKNRMKQESKPTEKKNDPMVEYMARVWDIESENGCNKILSHLRSIYGSIDKLKGCWMLNSVSFVRFNWFFVCIIIHFTVWFFVFLFFIFLVLGFVFVFGDVFNWCVVAECMSITVDIVAPFLLLCWQQETIKTMRHFICFLYSAAYSGKQIHRKCPIHTHTQLHPYSYSYPCLL